MRGRRRKPGGRGFSFHCCIILPQVQGRFFLSFFFLYFLFQVEGGAGRGEAGQDGAGDDPPGQPCPPPGLALGLVRLGPRSGRQCGPE